MTDVRVGVAVGVRIGPMEFKLKATQFDHNHNAYSPPVQRHGTILLTLQIGF